MTRSQEAAAPADPLISYSINAEDVLLRRVFADRRTGFFVDVGAEHPVNGNDLFGLYRLGWRGINVEPNPAYFALLVQQRPEDLNLQLFLSDQPADAQPFFIVENTGLSTGDAEQAAIHAGQGTDVHRVEVRAVTLKQVLDEARPPPIDILKIDVEGFEDRVLRGNDWERYRPSLIMLEATLPNSPVRRQTTITAYLEGVGYRFVHHDGLNDFFVEQDFVPPPDCFRAPNVFDQVVRWDTVALRDTYDDLRDRFTGVEHYARTLEGERDSLQGERNAMDKALSEADRALDAKQRSLEEKQRSEQRLSAALDATSRVAIDLLANGPEQVDMTLAQAGLLPLPGQAAEPAETGRDLVVVDNPQALPTDDRHLLAIQLQMVQARLGALRGPGRHRGARPAAGPHRLPRAARHGKPGRRPGLRRRGDGRRRPRDADGCRNPAVALAARPAWRPRIRPPDRRGGGAGGRAAPPCLPGLGPDPAAGPAVAGPAADGGPHRRVGPAAAEARGHRGAPHPARGHHHRRPRRLHAAGGVPVAVRRAV